MKIILNEHNQNCVEVHWLIQHSYTPKWINSDFLFFRVSSLSIKQTLFYDAPFFNILNRNLTEMSNKNLYLHVMKAKIHTTSNKSAVIIHGNLNRRLSD